MKRIINQLKSTQNLSEEFRRKCSETINQITFIMNLVAIVIADNSTDNSADNQTDNPADNASGPTSTAPTEDQPMTSN